MLPSLSRGLRLALWLAPSAGYVAWSGHSHAAYAKGADDDQGGDDDEDKADDKGDEDQPEDDKDQPPVTAGGLFTMQTYPVNELLRPLTITQNIAQVRLGVGTDVSAKGAFGSAGVSLEGLYGVSDNFEVVGGFTSAYNFKQFGVYAGFEGALVYDTLDIRLAANLHRTAIPRYCNTDTAAPMSCALPDGTQPNIPDGNYDAGGTKFSLDLGFPFRYDFKPEIAIIALQTLMSIDFNQAKDRPRFDASGMSIQGSFGENKVTPDLNPSIGIATNPIPQLSAVVYAQLRIPDFDTSTGNFMVPVTARVEVSPNQKFDVGLEFTLLNVMPPEGQGAFDNRFVSLFVQSRFGK
jgi:hypothetical protein